MRDKLTIAILVTTALGMMLLGCARSEPLLQVGPCGQDQLLPIPPNATPAERQRIQWHNNDYACHCGLHCPDEDLPS